MTTPSDRPLAWLGAEGEALRVAFSRVFGAKWRPFGSPSLKLGGLSDGREGVQWNVAYDPRDGARWVGVNLEGMAYDDWPIARLIESELKRPTLVGLVRSTAALRDVILVWHRDYWPAQSRVEIQEQEIAPTPIALGDLTEEMWRQSLDGAAACLDARRKRRGRAVQRVTLMSGRVVEGEVSPHLMFRWMGRAGSDWEAMMRETKGAMQPLHEWANRLASKPVRF